MEKAVKIGVLGASGYTGADLVRLALGHPLIEVTLLTANTHAGKRYADVFPHMFAENLPELIRIEEADWGTVDAIFCGLPHGTTQDLLSVIRKEHPDLPIIDLSADFRLSDPATYAAWYGRPHTAEAAQGGAVYGLTEFARDALRGAKLIACPGCYPTAVLLALLPLAGPGAIDATDIVVDAKSGVSGAGRGLKENTLFCEAGEGLSPYGVARHRHMPEIEQELSKAAGQPVTISFTPHLIPMSRGELVTCYVKTAENGAKALRTVLEARYADEPFVHLLPEGTAPRTQMVRGSNHCVINVFEDRIPGRAIVIAAIDNLVKGSSGQALQNFNVVFGLEETIGLTQTALFP